MINLKGFIKTKEVYLNGELLSLEDSLKLFNHSPSGFNWGYHGSGCAQLALAITQKVFGDDLAREIYQNLKVDFISKLPRKDFETEIDLDSWFNKIKSNYEN